MTRTHGQIKPNKKTQMHKNPVEIHELTKREVNIRYLPLILESLNSPVQRKRKTCFIHKSICSLRIPPHEN